MNHPRYTAKNIEKQIKYVTKVYILINLNILHRYTGTYSIFISQFNTSLHNIYEPNRGIFFNTNLFEYISYKYIYYIYCLVFN